MNKKEFIDAIAAETGFSKADTNTFYDAFVSTIFSELKSGESVKLIGFGNFEVKDRKARNGVNPKTGEKIKVAATKVPTFKAGTAFKEEIKKK